MCEKHVGQITNTTLIFTFVFKNVFYQKEKIFWNIIKYQHGFQP